MSANEGKLRRLCRQNPLWTLTALLLIGGGLLYCPPIRSMRASAYCVEAAALAGLYGLIYQALKLTNTLPDVRSKKLSLTSVALFLAITLFSTYFVFHKVANDHTVYYFDYRNYWEKTIAQGEAFLWDPYTSLKVMYQSILSDDYNTFICLFTILPVQLLGKSFLSFVIVIQLLFNLSAAFVLATAAKKFLAKLNVHMPWLFCYFSASLCPSVFLSSAHGYPDSLALVFVAILLLLAIDFRWQRPQYGHAVLMGLVLPLCMITRRYFSFYLINFAVMWTVCAAMEAFRALRSGNPRALRTCCSGYLIVGFLSLGIMLILFRPLLINGLNNNYQFAYTAFRSGNLLKRFCEIVRGNGGIAVALALVGALIGVCRRETRSFSLGLLLGTLISCFLFFQIQDMGPHHQLLVAAPIDLFMTACFGFLANGMLQRAWRRLLALAIGGLLAINFASGWIVMPAWMNPHGLFTQSKVLSIQRNDLEELHNLVSCLNELEGGAYVLACGGVLNSDVVRYLNYPYKSESVRDQYPTNDIDLRDGFPTQFFEAKKVVVTTPQELGQGAENQRVIGALAQHLLDGSGFARHYERLESFALDGGITAVVYRRFEDWTQEDYDQLREEFEGYYPDYPELFADRIHPGITLTNGTI